MIRLILSFAMVGFVNANCLADIVFSSSGPISSAAAKGNAGNGFHIGANGSSSVLNGTMQFNGTLTEVQTATFASEARWEIKNLSSFGGASTFDYQPSTTGNFSGSIAISNTRNGLFWLNSNDSLRFEAFEFFDDGGGVDSNWSNITFNFTNAITPTFVGNYGFGTSFTLDTETSGFDTEIALFSLDGTMLATDDDSGTGLLSVINGGMLAKGEYLLIGAGFNSSFASGFAIPGIATGSLNVRINGTTVSSGTLAAGSFRVLQFDVIPEPSTCAAGVWLGVLGLAFGTRRKR